MERKCESKGMRVNMNKTKVMISGERQMVWQKAARWPVLTDREPAENRALVVY